MYLSDLGDYTTAAAAFVADNDRALYRPFYDAAKAFCAANRFILGGGVGIDLLLGRPVNIGVPWDIYTHGDPFGQAKRFTTSLTDVHSPHVPVHTLVLRTDIKQSEYTVSVAARQLFRLHALPTYRGATIADIVAPVERDGVLVMPPELQLIAVYHDLYTPSKADQWASLHEIAAALSTVRLASRQGGRSGKRKNRADMITPQSFARSFDFIKHLAGDDLLVGSHAAAVILGDVPPRGQRVQFISAREPAAICSALNRVETVRSSRGGLNFTHAKLALNIDDWRLTKHVIYISNGREQHPIAEVFNASTFEMVPVYRDGIAATYVVLRFAMIDMWSLRMVAARGHTLTDRIDEISTQVGRLTAFADGDPTARNPRTFIGVYSDPIVARRQFIKAQGVRFHPFYPAKASLASRQGGDIVFASTAIDTLIDPDTKQQILRKVTGRAAMSSARDDVIMCLEAYRARTARNTAASSARSWGIGKTLSAYYFKNAAFLPWIPARIENYVDIGCGDGLDVVALGQRYHVGHATCADIEDHRATAAKRSSEYIAVALGQPLNIADGAATLVAVFHSIHHMRDDVAARLADIVRITARGGRIFIKDHDVTTAAIASNVDFEHLVYMVAEPAWADMPVSALMGAFGTHEPMRYWSADALDDIMTGLGTKRLMRAEINRRTSVFGAVYEVV